MSKRKLGKRSRLADSAKGSQRRIATIVVMLALIAAGVTAASWSAIKLRSAEPQSQPPLAKEYIYAGGRLVSTEEPQGTGCSYSISPTSRTFTASGGSDIVNVTAGTGCAWTGASNVGWITITSGASGTGNGSVNYSVASNTVASPRTGTMTIASQTFTVNQDGASGGCTYSISPTSNSVGAGSGSATVSVTTQTGCTWTAVSNAAWISITSGSSGTGNGTVGYSFTANTGPARSGTMTIAGQTFTLNQSSGCSFAISPSSQSFAASGGTGSVTVTAGAGCTWTATSNAGWITITSGATGSGNGTVGFTVASNSGASRTGTMAIAGQTFTVTQSAGGGGCTYSITPVSKVFTSIGGVAAVNITAGAGCAWTSVSNASWITITTGTSGSGNGQTKYQVAANSTGAQRVGTLTIAGQTHTVTQNP